MSNVDAKGDLCYHGHMRISIDVAKLSRDIRRNLDAIGAVKKTTSKVGYGAVMTGHRKGSARERSRRREEIRAIRAAGIRRAAPLAYRVLSGWGVANFLASRGHDPFEYPPEDVAFVAASIQEEVGDAVEEAYRTGRPQMERIRRVLKAGADHLREAAQDQIRQGELAKNAPRYARRKARLAEHRPDLVTPKYGSPPPYGVKTGQFVEGIRSTFFVNREPPRSAR